MSFDEFSGAFCDGFESLFFFLSSFLPGVTRSSCTAAKKLSNAIPDANTLAFSVYLPCSTSSGAILPNPLLSSHHTSTLPCARKHLPTSDPVLRILNIRIFISVSHLGLSNANGTHLGHSANESLDEVKFLISRMGRIMVEDCMVVARCGDFIVIML